MIATAGLFDLVVRSSLLLAMIWLAAAAVRKTGGSAAMRHMVWLLGLAALILFPFLSALMPPLPFPILPNAFAVAPVAMPAAAIAATAPAGPLMAAPPASFGLGDLAQLLYLAVAAGLLGRFALGHFMLARLWRRARPVRHARWTELIDGLTAGLGIRRPIALRIAAGPAMPMTWGTLRPKILLPAEALAWTDERRRIVLLHELAHVARRDSLSRSATAIVCALYWLHPAIWYAARRMRLEQEHACDDLVLSLGAKASAYARNLLEVAGTFQPPAIVGSLSVAMARTSELERRLTAIVRRGPRRRSSSRFVAGSGAAALLTTLAVATVAPVAALRPLPARASNSQPMAENGAPLPALAAPVPPAVPARPTRPAPPSPVAPLQSLSPPAAMPAEDYDGARERYGRELDAYHLQLAQYRRDLDAHYRRVDELRSQGNLANSGNGGNGGNSGNSGNSGNPGMPARPGQPAIPATLPTPPTAPTAPTAPTPVTAPERLKPVSQGP